MILGFTGTRQVPTDWQRGRLNEYFFDHDINGLHHGCCVGADLRAHRTAINYAVPVIVHPPIKDIYLAEECLFMPTPSMIRDDPTLAAYDITVLARKEYLARDRDIVHASDQLVAMPNGPRRPHSGTWYTIDYALECSVPVDIIWPDGRLEPLSSTLCKDIARGFCSASVDGYCVGGTSDGQCHG